MKSLKTKNKIGDKWTMKGKKLKINHVSCTMFEAVNSKICFILSGTGYTYDKPILYYATQLMVEKGYDVIQIHYSFEKDLFAQSDEMISQTIYELVNQVVITQLREVSYKEIAFIGKSLGTIPIVNHYMQQDFHMPVKFMSLTPVLSINRLYMNLKQSKYHSLVIIGSSDPHYDPEKITSLANHQIVVMPDANHSLEVEKDVMKSLQVLKQSIEAIGLFVS